MFAISSRYRYFLPGLADTLPPGLEPVLWGYTPQYQCLLEKVYKACEPIYKTYLFAKLDFWQYRLWRISSKTTIIEMSHRYSPGRKWLSLEEIVNSIFLVFSRAPWCPVYEKKVHPMDIWGNLFLHDFLGLDENAIFLTFFRVFTVPEKPLHQKLSPKVHAVDFFNRKQDT